MWATTIRPISGRNGGNWKRTRRPARRSWWRYGNAAFQEIAVPKYVEVSLPAAPKPALFAHVADDVLLGYGVPAEWLADVRLSNEDTLLELADHLPGEAAEALLDLATGVAPKIAKPVAVGTDPFAHPDAQRRFRVMANVDELERALDYPWEKWTIFLHPAAERL